MDSVLEIFLLTPDLEMSREVYESVLGLTPLEEEGPSVVYESATCRFKLQQDYDADTFADFNLEPPSSSGRGSGTFIVLQTERELEAIQESLADFDAAECLVPPSPMPWAEAPVMFVQDPHGYTFELRG